MEKNSLLHEREKYIIISTQCVTGKQALTIHEQTYELLRISQCLLFFVLEIKYKTGNKKGIPKAQTLEICL